MSRAELNYAGGLSFGIDISELARPEVLRKIVSFVGAERGWIGLLDGGDRAIERIVTSTMMPDRGNMSALKAISKIILSSCRERESDGWHLCTLRSINPSEAVYLAPNCAHAEDGRLYSFSEFCSMRTAAWCASSSFLSHCALTFHRSGKNFPTSGWSWAIQ